ncbi:sarcosine oxidase-like protein [Roseivivax marinus]|jgi:sarcosine oxidase subunit gamma|uniref:Sarcosine oxidase-like protein n=1 Tax=Roseivivax marinus TaxID=1379903 RepID=W4HNZ5_9RHOB|nr:sarcosine oxidase subunit gamma family protein [Roseivivax marinus]ETW14394.1 sarcosine oxidase-like protein [Roseivivax marinus]
MFDATSHPARPALEGATFDGLVRVEAAGLTGMITLRGDVDAIGMPVADVTGLDVPDTLGITGDGVRALAWMSPDEMMLFCDYAEAEELAASLAGSLEGEHALVVNVSDARAAFRLSGPEPRLREVLAKLTPADVRPEALPPGMIRRSRLAQVAGAFWFDDAGDLRVVCFRSVADYVWALLTGAARPGSEVDHFRDVSM